MRLSTLLAGLCLLLCTFSCKKEKDPSIEGLWMGSYQSISDPSNAADFAFIVKPGGELTVESNLPDGPAYAHGTWTLAGSKFSGTFSYTGTTFAFIADYRSSGTMSNGTYGVNPAKSGDGTFSLSRVD